MKFEIKGNQYQTGKLDGFDQLLLVQKLAGPVKALLTPEFLKQLAEDYGGADENAMIKYIGPFIEAAQMLSPADLKEIINTCLKVCQRNHVGAWSPILTQQGFYAFDDLRQDGLGLLMITFYVIRENLSSFFEDLRLIWDQAGEAPKP